MPGSWPGPWRSYRSYRSGPGTGQRSALRTNAWDDDYTRCYTEYVSYPVHHEKEDLRLAMEIVVSGGLEHSIIRLGLLLERTLKILQPTVYHFAPAVVHLMFLRGLLLTRTGQPVCSSHPFIVMKANLRQRCTIRYSVQYSTY